jgi:hypothetical protein
MKKEKDYLGAQLFGAVKSDMNPFLKLSIIQLKTKRIIYEKYN